MPHKNGKPAERLFVNEALMVHAGETLFAIKLSGAKEIHVIGDANQITFINGTKTCDTNIFYILQIAKKQEL